MELRLLEYFLTVVREENISRAFMLSNEANLTFSGLLGIITVSEKRYGLHA